MDVSTCTNCDADYNIDEGECVMRCDVDFCLSCVNDPRTCELCDDGYDIFRSKCIAEIPNCKIYVDETTCKTCTNGNPAGD